MPPSPASRQTEGSGGWFATPLAQRLMRDEQHQTIPRLTASFGRTGLYLRCAPDAPEELSGNMLQRVLHLHRSEDVLAGDVRCLETQLPLLRESVDLVYLLHAFEAGARPLELLLEIERVLAPEGNLMLVGLNPWSPMRLRWMGSGLRTDSAGRHRARLQDAGFEVVAQQGLGPIWPALAADGDLPAPHRRSDPCAGLRAGFLLHARKRRAGMTPLRPQSVALQAGMRAG